MLCGELKKIFDLVWSGECIPGELSKGIIIVLGKKGDTTYCSNNRGITLRSTASKVFQIIILQRLHDGLEGLYRENQCGFRRNRSCVDRLHSLRLIIQLSTTVLNTMSLCISILLISRLRLILLRGGLYGKLLLIMGFHVSTFVSSRLSSTQQLVQLRWMENSLTGLKLSQAPDRETSKDLQSSMSVLIW